MINYGLLVYLGLIPLVAVIIFAGSCLENGVTAASRNTRFQAVSMIDDKAPPQMLKIAMMPGCTLLCRVSRYGHNVSKGA